MCATSFIRRAKKHGWRVVGASKWSIALAPPLKSRCESVITVFLDGEVGVHGAKGITYRSWTKGGAK